VAYSRGSKSAKVCRYAIGSAAFSGEVASLELALLNFLNNAEPAASSPELAPSPDWRFPQWFATEETPTVQRGRWKECCSSSRTGTTALGVGRSAI